MYKLGIDLGGTKIEGIVLDQKGNEHFRQRIPTEQEKGYEAILDNIRRLYDAMTTAVGHAAHAFGIGTPGAISRRTGLLKNSNTQCLNGKPILQDLEHRLQHRVAIQNDANCFAMAEALYGAGKGKEMVFGVIMGTGCGGGIVHKGSVITGLQSIAGEWGHMTIDPNGPPCYCGKRGCAESFISGGGLQARWQEQHGTTRSFKEIESAYLHGDPDATEFMQAFFVSFGRSMANLINILDPDIVVLGGGVSKMDAIYTEGVKQVARHIFSDSMDTPIVKHQVGDSAGVIGAALIGV
jgi:fructokinase